MVPLVYMMLASTHPDFVADALQLLGVPACAVNADGEVLVANGELAALLGFDAAGLPVAELFARHVRAASVEQLDAALRSSSDTRRWDSCLACASGQQVAVQAWLK